MGHQYKVHTFLREEVVHLQETDLANSFINSYVKTGTVKNVTVLKYLGIKKYFIWL